MGGLVISHNGVKDILCDLDAFGYREVVTCNSYVMGMRSHQFDC